MFKSLPSLEMIEEYIGMMPHYQQPRILQRSRNKLNHTTTSIIFKTGTFAHSLAPCSQWSLAGMGQFFGKKQSLLE